MEVVMSDVPSISQLIIKNFGCIGNREVAIEIDDIVVLVGPNNAGKSTILRAFEVVTDSLKLELEDFHNKVCADGSHPEIEVHSIAIQENKPGDEWCEVIGDEKFLIKEKWTWTSVGQEPTRIGFNVQLGRWAQNGDGEMVPWGMNNVAKARRPKPHRVNTFDDHQVQANAIISLLKSLLEDSIKKIKENDSDDVTKYERIISNLKELRDSSKVMQTESISEVEREVNLIIGKIFPSHEMKISSPESVAPIKVDFLGDEFDISMGPINGEKFSLEKQGSGSRRTALWAILKLLADKGMKAKKTTAKAKSYHESVGPNKAHVLLLDEPEVSLHPAAVAIARDVLYSLPENSNWQVMIATHSPSFIDLSKNNTTIIRIDKEEHNFVGATTLYRPEQAQLDENDKDNLKLMNLFDSHISEAFFGGRVLIVEGDTEYSAFSYIKNNELALGNNYYHDVNIIRARGKVTVASMMKVLNHFKNKYYVLHDTDAITVKSKRKNRERSVDGLIVYDSIEIANPAWTNNSKIKDQMCDNSRVVASIINFEDAYFSETVAGDKPENCINHIKDERGMYDLIKQLLDSVLEKPGVSLPEGAIAWSVIEEIQTAVEKRINSVSVIS
jgi:putative ATP-dependent endonuclease of OLD family